MLPDIQIESSDNLHVYGIVIKIPGQSEPRMMIPFRQSSIVLAEPINENDAVVVGVEGSQICVAIIDVLACSIIRQADFYGRVERFQLSRNKTWLFATGSGLLAIWDIVTLSKIAEFHGVVWEGENGRLYNNALYYTENSRTKFHNEALEHEYRNLSETRKLVRVNPDFLTERDDGQIVFLLEESFLLPDRRLDRDALKYSLCTVDPTTWALTRRILMQGGRAFDARTIKSIDPSGRRAVFGDLISIPFFSGEGSAFHTAFGTTIPEVTNHYDCADDSVNRYGVVFEHWQLDDKPDARPAHIVRMLSARELFPRKTAEELAAINLKLQFEAVVAAHGADEKLLANHPQIPSGRNGQMSPANLPNNRPVGTVVNGFASKIFWEPDGGAYWVYFRDISIRRVLWTGEIGPLVTFERWPVGTSVNETHMSMQFQDDGSIRFFVNRYSGHITFHPSALNAGRSLVQIPAEHDNYTPFHPYSKAFQQFAEEQTSVRVELSEVSAGAVDLALLDVSRRIEANFEKMIGKYTFRLYFVVGHRQISEPEMFQTIIDQEMPVTEGLRAVLSAYLEQVKPDARNQLWYEDEEGIGALGYALRALVLLDPDALDIFRLYLARRDTEHEGFCLNVVLPEFVEKHGWRDEKALRFGVYCAINGFNGAGFDRKDAYSLIVAASRMVDAKSFAKLVIDEASNMDLKPQWNHQTTPWYISNFGAILDQDEPYQAEVAQCLGNELNRIRQLEAVVIRTNLTNAGIVFSAEDEDVIQRFAARKLTFDELLAQFKGRIL